MRINIPQNHVYMLQDISLCLNLKNHFKTNVLNANKHGKENFSTVIPSLNMFMFRSIPLGTSHRIHYYILNFKCFSAKVVKLAKLIPFPVIEKWYFLKSVLIYVMSCKPITFISESTARIKI